MGEAEIQLCVFDCRLRGCDGSFRRLDGGFALSFLLRVVVELALGDSACFGERRVAVDVDYRELELRLGLLYLALGLRKLSLGLIKRGLKWAGVNLEQDLTLGNLRAFFVILLYQVSRRLGLNLGVHETVQRPNPFAGQRYVRGLDLNYSDGHRRRRAASGGALVATTRKQRGAYEQCCGDGKRSRYFASWYSCNTCWPRVHISPRQPLEYFLLSSESLMDLQPGAIL